MTDTEEYRKTKANGERLLSASDHILEHCEKVAERMEATGEDVKLIAEGLAAECTKAAAFVRDIGERESKRCVAFYRKVQETHASVENMRVSFASVFDDPEGAPSKTIDAAGELAKTAIEDALALEPPKPVQ